VIRPIVVYTTNKKKQNPGMAGIARRRSRNRPTAPAHQGPDGDDEREEVDEHCSFGEIVHSFLVRFSLF
jgi:hypothetical protein